MKASVEAAAIVPAAQAAVRSLVAQLPLREVATMDERLRSSMAAPRLQSLLLALMAGLALALAITGIYGVLAYQVNLRRRETAIRRALGATAATVIAATMASGLRLAAAGLVLGTLGAAALTRTLSAVLFQVSPRDPAAFALVGVVL